MNFAAFQVSGNEMTCEVLPINGMNRQQLIEIKVSSKVRTAGVTFDSLAKVGVLFGLDSLIFFFMLTMEQRC